MIQMSRRFTIFSAFLILCFGETLFAQNAPKTSAPNVCRSALTGVYRIDTDRSDELFSVIEGASSKVPYSEQQQFFMDLAVRLTPPDLLAIECRGKRVSLGSSRAAKVDFTADGVTRVVSRANGKIVRSRIGFERGNLVFASSGGIDDSLNFTFTLLDNDQSLRVTRRISAEELIEPVVIQTVYEKINDVARWDIFDDAQIAEQTADGNAPDPTPAETTRRTPLGVGKSAAVVLRAALDQWIAATNQGDIAKQMSFYMPELKAFYLARNVSQKSVRAEKNRVFARAKSIDIRAADPEIIFQDAGRAAIMRFRKTYKIEGAAGRRSGEVIQELRWRQTGGEWLIFSERDIKVIR